MNTNYVEIDGLRIQVNTEYLGTKPWVPAAETEPMMYNGRVNTFNHSITVYTDMGDTEFEAWGSFATPDCFEADEYGPYDAFRMLCGDAWDYIADSVEDLVDPSIYDGDWEYRRAVDKLRNALGETCEKLYDIGMDDDMILKVADSEMYDGNEEAYDIRYDSDGTEVIHVLGRD